MKVQSDSGKRNADAMAPSCQEARNIGIRAGEISRGQIMKQHVWQTKEFGNTSVTLNINSIQSKTACQGSKVSKC